MNNRYLTQLRLVVVLTSMVVVLSGRAQTSEPPKEMLEQIIALKTFFTYAKKGYEIVHTGLQTVNRIKDGDFRLHDLQFTQLHHVSPATKRTAARYGTALTQVSLLLHCQKLLRQIAENKTLTPDEIRFCQRTVNNIMNECKQSVDAFIQLLTAGELELTEDQRMDRLFQVSQKTTLHANTVRSFSEVLGQMSINRIAEQQSIDHSRKINQLK